MKTKAFYLVQEIGDIKTVDEEITKKAYKSIMQGLEKSIEENKYNEDYFFNKKEVEFESETRTTKSITYTINATHTTLYKVECKKGYQFK